MRKKLNATGLRQDAKVSPMNFIMSLGILGTIVGLIAVLITMIG